MPNELAHSLTSESLKDFSQIDSRGTGSLNLLDIMRYEALGPEQSKVGKFLEDNYDTLSGIASYNHGPNPKGDRAISKDDLSYVNQLSSSDPAEVKHRLNSDKFLAIGSDAANDISWQLATGMYPPGGQMPAFGAIAGYDQENMKEIQGLRQ